MQDLNFAPFCGKVLPKSCRPFMRNGIPCITLYWINQSKCSLYRTNFLKFITFRVWPTTPLYASCSMPEVHIRTREVKRVLANLDMKKSSGPDDIPARVLKLCSSSLAKPLRNLFFISFKTGKFPSCWKIANVEPVPKTDPSDPGNYRPIAICSNLAKVMESILNHKLMKYLEENSLLNDRQYGFRKNRSTGDLMALLTET